MACTVQIKIPDTLAHRLDGLVDVRPRVDRMLRNRDESSSKCYPEIPSVVAKSLIAKYQRNKKWPSVSNFSHPDLRRQGTADKVEGEGVRISALFQKEILPLTLVHLVRSRQRRPAEYFGGVVYARR